MNFQKIKIDENKLENSNISNDVYSDLIQNRPNNNDLNDPTGQQNNKNDIAPETQICTDKDDNKTPLENTLLNNIDDRNNPIENISYLVTENEKKLKEESNNNNSKTTEKNSDSKIIILIKDNAHIDHCKLQNEDNNNNNHSHNDQKNLKNPENIINNININITKIKEIKVCENSTAENENPYTNHKSKMANETSSFYKIDTNSNAKIAKFGLLGDINNKLNNQPSFKSTYSNNNNISIFTFHNNLNKNIINKNSNESPQNPYLPAYFGEVSLIAFFYYIFKKIILFKIE